VRFLKISMPALAFAGATFAMMSFAQAQVVVIGASNSAGKGVSSSEAWPAQLQSMLAAKGSSTQITSAAVSGQTTAGALSSLSSVLPAGTKIVLMAQGTQNDLKKGVSHEDAMANKTEMNKLLKERGIRVINVLPIIHAVLRQPGMIQDDHIHMTAEGHRKVAAQLAASIR
jgi:acyl-CoA thioesterase I